MTNLPGGEPAGDQSIAEHGGHIKGTTVGWIAVGLICSGFVVGGIALIESLPWLFFIGIGAVVVGGIVSWATHAMSNVTARVKPGGATATAAGSVSGGAQEPARN